MNDRPDSIAPGQPDFLRRALIAVSLASVAVVVFLLLWQAADVFVLLFAGVLLAVVLRGAADWLARRTGLPGGWALAAVVVGLALLFAAAGWFLGAEFASQYEQISKALPASWEQLRGRLKKYEWWPQSLQLPSAATLLRRGNLFERVTGVFSATLGAATNAFVVLFLGLFIASQPGRYRAGVLHLVPLSRRDRVSEVLDALGRTLRRWAAGRLLDMAVVGLVTTAGLYFLDAPAPLALGLLTGVVVFVPYIGPLLSVVPAVLLASTQGGNMAAYVALLYLGIQTIESYLLQPLIQDKSVDLPPAVILGSQLLLGVLLGALGVMFATPLAAAAMVMVKMLYVQSVLGDPIEAQG